jgi:hypothetical protein
MTLRLEDIGWEEGKHPRAESGKFAPKEGIDDVEEKGDTPEEKSRIKKAGIILWKAINVWPEVAKSVVSETGASPWVSKTAYLVSMIGDTATPGLPTGSAAVIIAATIKNPVAPFRAARKAIDRAKEKIGKGKKMMAEIDFQTISDIAEQIEAKSHQEYFIQLLAIAIEEVGDPEVALKLATKAYEMGTPS